MRTGLVFGRGWFGGLTVIGLVAVLLAPASPTGFGVGAASAQDDDDGPLAASTRTVNVELILDASGSMAENLPGTENQSRMEAAKAAMRDVIERIPERDGLNVGFRIYGHEGSNSEADKAVSCASTDLLVPLEGVDQELLLAQVETFEPTGWTPLTLALEEAGQDFASGGESVTNAVIMVTDGEETCDGDPCAAAAGLNAAEIGLTTHVVGFALTDTQREAVRCIAEEGGGQLFDAGDAEELTDAVFAAFEQVEATPAPSPDLALEVGGFIGGNAFGLLDSGCEAGALAVVAVGAYEDGLGLPVVACNGTDDDVQDVTVSATAREADGGLLGSGASLDMAPFVVEAGGLAFGRVYFGAGEIADDVEFGDVGVESAAVDEEDATRFDLVVEELNPRPAEIVAGLRNEGAEPVLLTTTQIACFAADGALLGITDALPGGTIDPDGGAVANFEIDGSGPGSTAGPCPAFLVAASGVAGL